MFVEVVNQNQAVIVLVRCFEDTELEAVKMRSAVLKEVHKVKAKHCPATKAVVSIIVKPTLHVNGSLAQPIQKVTMEDLVHAINEGSKRVLDNSVQHLYINKDLLCFEPYVGIKKSKLLRSFLDPDEVNEFIPEEVLSSISALLEEAGAQPRHAKQVIQQVSDKLITYQTLRNLFDMYSVLQVSCNFLMVSHVM